MERDGRLSAADSVALYIDPGQTRRNAYNFEVGAAGGRTDELELNNTTELREWNAIWTSGAKRVSDGYTVEFAIPFASLSYDSSQTVWGLTPGAASATRTNASIGGAGRRRWISPTSVNPAISPESRIPARVLGSTFRSMA